MGLMDKKNILLVPYPDSSHQPKTNHNLGKKQFLFLGTTSGTWVKRWGQSPIAPF